MLIEKMTSRPGFTETASAQSPGAKDVFHLKRENNRLRRHAMTFSCLGKLAGANIALLNQWKARLAVPVKKSLAVRPLTGDPLIVGLTESGIIPSALMHQQLADMNISSRWICSTRRPASGLCFTEHHSHAPHQTLPLPDFKPSEIWLIEDEITTGRTLLQVCLGLCRHLGVQKVRIFAFADIRSFYHKTMFRRMMADGRIDYTLHSLFDVNGIGEKSPDDSNEGKWNACNASCTLQEDIEPAGWLFPGCRPALGNPVNSLLNIPANLKGSLLAVGETIDLGLQVVRRNPKLHLHHVTLSPWEIDGRHILNRLDISHQYYLYNTHSLASPLHLLYDPIDKKIAETLEFHLKKQGYEVRKIDFDAISKNNAEQNSMTKETDKR